MKEERTTAEITMLISHHRLSDIFFANQSVNNKHSKQTLRFGSSDYQVSGSSAVVQPRETRVSNVSKAAHRIAVTNYDSTRIFSALFPKPKKTISPQYLSQSADIRDSVNSILSGANKLSGQAVEDFATERVAVKNMHAFLQSGITPYQVDEAALEESKKFFTEVAQHINPVLQTLKAVGLTKEELEIFIQFAAQMLPTLQLMGYPDAIMHAAQVAQLTVIGVKRKRGSNADILQAATIALCHDPKNGLSEDLISHPAKASVLLPGMLSQPPVKRLLKKYFNNDMQKVVTFIQGAGTAVSINNDSGFVCNLMCQKLENALTELRASRNIIDEIITVTKARYQAISLGLPAPPAYSDKALGWLHKAKLGTGLYEMDTKKFGQAVTGLKQSKFCPEDLKTASSDEVMSRLQAGTLSKDTATFLYKALKGIAISEVLITWFSAVSNSLDLLPEEGKLAAEALTTSDQLSLALGKLIGGNGPGNGETPVARTWQFTTNNTGFRECVAGVLPADQPTAQAWQVQVYMAALTALEELTGECLKKKLPVDFDSRTNSKKSEAIAMILTDENNWIVRDTGKLPEIICEANGFEPNNFNLGTIDLSVRYEDQTKKTSYNQGAPNFTKVEVDVSVARAVQKLVSQVMNKHYVNAMKIFIQEQTQAQISKLNILL